MPTLALVRFQRFDGARINFAPNFGIVVVNFVDSADHSFRQPNLGRFSLILGEIHLLPVKMAGYHHLRQLLPQLWARFCLCRLVSPIRPARLVVARFLFAGYWARS
jgi:hypothetical protein